MANVMYQICLYDQYICGGEKHFELKRGQEYITSTPQEDKDEVRVFTCYWFSAPKEWFAGPLTMKREPI